MIRNAKKFGIALSLWILLSIQVGSPALADQANVVVHVATESALAATSGWGAEVMRDGFYSAGDGGSATYTWSPSSCTLDEGAGDGGWQVPAAGGGCWNVVWQANGLSVDVWGATGDFVHPDGASINAALMAAAAASSVGAGRSIYLNPAKSYWVTQSVVVPSGVALKCAAKIEKQHTNQNYVSDGCAIYSAPNLSATVDGALVSGAVINNGGTIEGIRVYQDNIHFAGQPTTAHQLASIIHNYTSTGTGVALVSPDSIVEDVAVAGYNLDIQDSSLARGSIRHVLMEGANCLKYGTIGDYLKEEDIECWPFYSTNRSISEISAAISNIADNGSGSWRVTLSTAPGEPLQTGDEVYIGGSGAIGVPLGALGRHNITVVDSTHVDLTGSKDTPVVTGNSTGGIATITSLSTSADLWPGETVTGPCISGTATLEAIWPGQSAITVSSNAVSTTTGCPLTFQSQVFAAGGSPLLTFDARGGQHGVGVEFGSGANGVLASNMYIWAHDVALQFDGVTGNQINLFSVDASPSEYRSERIGVKFESGSYWNFVEGNSQTSGGIFAVNQGGKPSPFQNRIKPGRVDGWVWGAAENDAGSLVLEAMSDADNTAIEGQWNGNVLNVAGQPLWLVNGTADLFGNYYSSTGSFSGLTLSPESVLGDVVPPSISGEALSASSENAPDREPSLNVILTQGGADNKHFQLETTDGMSLVLRKLNDAGTAATNFLQFSAQGAATSQIYARTPIQDGAYAAVQPSNGGTVIIPDGQDFALIEPLSPLATLTVQLPTCASMYDGKRAGFLIDQQITGTLKITATAGAVITQPQSPAAAGGLHYFCKGATAQWFLN